MAISLHIRLRQTIGMRSREKNSSKESVHWNAVDEKICSIAKNNPEAFEQKTSVSVKWRNEMRIENKKQQEHTFALSSIDIIVSAVTSNTQPSIVCALASRKQYQRKNKEKIWTLYRCVNETKQQQQQ